jgi:NYN domain
MMNHAARQNIKTARLLSGDLDFEPVVRALVEMGVFVHVIGDKRTTARKLIAAADYFRPITFRDYHDWSSDELKLKFAIPPPPDSGDPEARARLLKEGSIAGKPCRLYELDQKFVINFEFENQRKSIATVSDDPSPQGFGKCLSRIPG